MSPPGRPRGEYRRAKREATLAVVPGCFRVLVPMHVVQAAR